MGFKPLTFKTFSDLIQLIKIPAKAWRGKVIPLGFKPKTFRTGI